MAPSPEEKLQKEFAILQNRLGDFGPEFGWKCLDDVIRSIIEQKLLSGQLGHRLMQLGCHFMASMDGQRLIRKEGINIVSKKIKR